MTCFGCGNKDDGKSNSSTNKGKRGGGDRAHQRALSAEDLYKDWTALKGAARMNKYMGKRIDVTGTVFHIIQGGKHGEYTMYIAAGTHKLVATFKDKGMAAKAKNVVKGAKVTINCSPVGMLFNNISIDNCELK